MPSSDKVISIISEHPRQPLLFTSEMITFQEVKDEISLSFLIAGCPLRCKGCHSADSWSETSRKPIKQTLDYPYLKERIEKYNSMISCVLFLGGEWHYETLKALLIQVKQEYSELKTCLYTGLDLIELYEMEKQYGIDSPHYYEISGNEIKLIVKNDQTNHSILGYLDYIKVGRWIEELGGLDSEKTNQRFYRIRN